MDDDDLLINQPLCVAHGQFQPCPTCRRSLSQARFMAIDPDKDKHIMFDYQVVRCHDADEFDEKVAEIGKSGREIVSVFYDYNSVTSAYVIVVRIHHST